MALKHSTHTITVITYKHSCCIEYTVYYYYYFIIIITIIIISSSSIPLHYLNARY